MMQTTEWVHPYPYPWQREQWQQLADRHKHNTLPHALMLYGPAGMGKFSFAKKFAEFLLCRDSTAEACGHCAACRLLQAGTHPDLLVIQPEENKKIIGIEQIRQLTEQLQQTSQQGGQQVVIIEPAEAMNMAAANALLKTLEEPQGQVFLFLVTHQPTLLPITLRSRCQKLNFSIQTQNDQIETWLQQQLAMREVKPLLQFAEGIPLTAFYLGQDHQLLKEQKLASLFLEIMEGQVEPLKAAASCTEFTPKKILNLLSYLLLDLNKLKYAVSSSYIFYQNLLEKMTVIVPKISQTKLLFMQEKILGIQAMLSKNINLNTQLLLEDMFITLSTLI